MTVPEQGPDQVHRISEDEREESGVSRKVIIGGVAAVATAAVVAAVFVGVNRDGSGMGEAGLEGEQRRVALSSVGHPLEASEELIEQSTPEAEAALAGTLGKPAGVENDNGIPERALLAYRQAEAGAAAEFANCHAPWWVIAGMAKVASDHAAGTTFDETGTTLAQIRGPRLDGRTLGTRLVVDTDNGELDGDAQYDRAMGPFQFLPGMWYLDARDGNGDGLANPDNIDDASLGAGAVLCGGGANLSTPEGLARGLYRYTADPAVVSAILAWGTHYQGTVVPPAPKHTPLPPSADRPPVPTASPQLMDAEGAPLQQPPGAAASPGSAPTQPGSGEDPAPSPVITPTAPAIPGSRVPSQRTPTPTPEPVRPTVDGTDPTSPPAQNPQVPGEGAERPPAPPVGPPQAPGGDTTPDTGGSRPPANPPVNPPAPQPVDPPANPPVDPRPVDPDPPAPPPVNDPEPAPAPPAVAENPAPPVVEQPAPPPVAEEPVNGANGQTATVSHHATPIQSPSSTASDEGGAATPAATPSVTTVTATATAMHTATVPVTTVPETTVTTAPATGPVRTATVEATSETTPETTSEPLGPVGTPETNESEAPDEPVGLPSPLPVATGQTGPVTEDPSDLSSVLATVAARLKVSA